MININAVKSYCCEDISLIENYELAIKDETQTWQCHHKLEIVDGESFSIKELKERCLYYHRPADELIFLTEKEHKILHGINMRKETRKLISDKSKIWHESPEGQEKCLFKKGMKSWNYGKPSPQKGTKKSPETIQRMKEAKKKWWDNHIIDEDEHLRRSEGGKKAAAKSRSILKEYGKEYSKLYKGRHWKIIDGKRVWL